MSLLALQLVSAGKIQVYFNKAQIGGLIFLTGTILLHLLTQVADVPRVVWLLVLALLWPSIAAMVVHSRVRPWLGILTGLTVLTQGGVAGYQFLLSEHYRSTLITGTLFNAGNLGNYVAVALPWLLSMAISTYQAAKKKGSLTNPVECGWKTASTQRWAHIPRDLSKNQKKLGNNWLGYYRSGFYLLTTVAATGILLLSGARAAWVGALVGVLVVLVSTWKLPVAHYAQRWRMKSWRWRAGWIAVLSIVIGTASWSLVRLQVASVYGRWQIYTIGTELFAQHYLAGIGWGNTTSQFNEQPAAYFATHAVPVARQLLAADTYVLFNSLLQVGVEAGVMGVVFWCVGIGFLWRIGRRSYVEAWNPAALGATGGLISLGVCSLFSYPFQVLPVVILAGLLLAYLPINRLTASRSYTGLSRVAGSGVLLLLVFIVGYREETRWRALRQWQRAAVWSQQRLFERAAPLYEQAKGVLANDGDFLYNYGVEAGLAGHSRLSIDLLQASRRYYSSSALYSYLGQAYEATNQPKRAAWCYQHASDMVPSYFYPRYRLFELYRTTGQRRRAVRVGEQILAYPAKIDTDLTWQIKYRVEQTLRTGL